jgi:uncharacterized protein CbrC (UPF0167 family)
MTTFRYFRDPHGSRSSSWQAEPSRCAICERERPGYTGPFYGLEQVDFVCEACLAGGRLGERGLTTNEADVEALRTQLRSRGIADGELVDERRAEVEERTPGVETWQDFLWPAHCGDFCRFEQEVGQAELTALAGDGDGASFFRAHLYDEEPAGLDWEFVPPAAPGAGEAYSVGIYLFRCVECDRPVLLWDAD